VGEVELLGFERKGTYGTLKGINDKLRGTVGDPRVVYEHSPDHEALGTIRVFENLPFFTGRSTLEGPLHAGLADGAVRLLHPVRSLERDVVSVPRLGLLAAEPRARRAAPRDDERLAVHREVEAHQGRGGEASGARAPVTIGDYLIYAVKNNANRYAIP
jgi:hypothetical protein